MQYGIYSPNFGDVISPRLLAVLALRWKTLVGMVSFSGIISYTAKRKSYAWWTPGLPWRLWR